VKGPFNYFKLFISLVRNPNVKDRLEEALIGEGTVIDFISSVIFKKGSPLRNEIFHNQNFIRDTIYFISLIF
jgi:hypothetical protein